MTLVIKPRDLTRVDPTLNLPSRLSMTDPATLLRESVKQLKEVGEQCTLYLKVAVYQFL